VFRWREENRREGGTRREVERSTYSRSMDGNKDLLVELGFFGI
jgi:hypothetical protein